MKRVFITMCAAAIALAFTSCKEEEQSSLDLGALQKTTVKGTVYYDVTDKDGDVETKAIPSGTTVYLDLIVNGNVVKTYTATTDASGKYSIELPASNGVSVSATAFVSFEGTNYEYDSEENEYVKKNFLFKGDGSTSITPNATSVINFEATSTLLDIL
ncbi:hypothetical protein FACS189434_04390 [Bacteroidia bacterium]|nr:hypothetical protein FACS189434_04390 [Bacteroidia bacterium]